MSDLTLFSEKLETRWASPENVKGEKGGACRNNDGRKRSACFILEPCESFTIAEVQGSSGMVRRIWMTIIDRSPKMLRGVRLDFYWDGACSPAVSAPIGDFFCQPLGRMSGFENELFSSPEARSFNCYIPMPFKTGMKMVVTNETDVQMDSLFYDVNYTLGDHFDSASLYFHAHWRRENPTTFRHDYEFLPKVEGRGRFLGVSVGVAADTITYGKSWWGEGEVKMYIDGDRENPTLCGTGTEDYIGTGWGQGAYAQRYQGCPLADSEKHQYGFYRLHVPDSIFFRHEIRVTIQQIGASRVNDPMRKGLQLMHGNKATRGSLFERQDDVSSCAYFYLHQPENGLPELNYIRMGVERPFRAVTRCIRNMRVSGFQPCKGNLQDLECPEKFDALEMTDRNFHQGFCDIHDEVAQRHGNEVVYFTCRFFCAEPMRLALVLGYDAPIKVWVEKKQIFHDPNGINPATVEKAKATYEAAIGNHEIVIAFSTNEGMAWGIYLRIERLDVTEEQLRQGQRHYAMPEISYTC